MNKRHLFLACVLMATSACNGGSSGGGEEDAGSDRDTDPVGGGDTDSGGRGETDSGSNRDTDSGGGPNTDSGDDGETDSSRADTSSPVPLDIFDDSVVREFHIHFDQPVDRMLPLPQIQRVCIYMPRFWIWAHGVAILDSIHGILSPHQAQSGESARNHLPRSPQTLDACLVEVKSAA